MLPAKEIPPGMTEYVYQTLVVLIGTAPIFTLVVWFLKRGPDREIAQLKTDLNSLGAKVSEMKSDVDKDRERTAALQGLIAENQRDIVAMLTVSAQAIQKDIHDVATKVAVLGERSDIADCFERFGQTVERAIVRVAGQPRNT